MRTFKTYFFTIIIGLFTISQALFAQEKKVLTLDDYGQWNSIRNASISPNGLWATYSYVPNDGDSRLFIRKIEGDTVRSIINGKQVDFSLDNTWVAYLSDLPEKEAEKLKKQSKPVVSRLELYNLTTNAVIDVENAASFSFSKASNYIAIHKNPADRKSEHKGSDLILKDLKGNQSLNIGNVSSYAFNEAGSLFAYLVDADGDNGNGIYLVDLSNHRTWAMHTGSYSYSQLTWNEKGNQLAALYGNKEEGNVERENTLYWASNLSAGMSVLNGQQMYSPESDPKFPQEMVISEYSGLTWNESNTQLFFGVRAQEKELKKEDELKANVDVWHWKDERVQSVQMIQAGRDRRATFTSVLNLASKKFYQLENEEMPNVNYSKKTAWAVGQSNAKYRGDVNLPGNFDDLYAINTTTGAKALITEKLYWKLGLSPNGQWTLYSRNGEVFGYNFNSGKTTNLSSKTGLNFENKEFDTPVEKPTYGVAGWSADGEWLMLNHKYDIWAVALNSDKAQNLTQGLGNEGEIRFRLTQLDPEADSYDLKQTLLLSAYGEWTKKSGYYSVQMGKQPKVLRYEDKMIGRPTKATTANTLMFTEQTFEEFPDYWVADLSFKNPKKITDANPQQANYKWGRRILVDYTDQRGHKLQATLALPADYEAGKKYPMVMYFYEKMSQRHHQYSMPTYDDRPHMSTYASNGYLVLMPDIVFDEGKPGSSALDDVTSAAKEVIRLGYADPENIGLQGHSWGGYESSFILTQTDMFKCVVTGAPLTNLISMYNIAYKASGSLNGPILEWSQGRMGVSPYENFELYRSQSPIHHAQNISTPFLILHGTADGAVDWNQGLEFYSTARRLGKEVILLSYPDEPHHLGKEDNQKDFQIKMKQYFDHFLKGTAAPLWMTQGIPQRDKKRVGPEVMGGEK
uniref:prolyl oligopeptidase family serine peptidase n=1 Tax=Roseivirga sp. TaxID=1964215 RepID=UPI0040478770